MVARQFWELDAAGSTPVTSTKKGASDEAPFFMYGQEMLCCGHYLLCFLTESWLTCFFEAYPPLSALLINGIMAKSMFQAVSAIIRFVFLLNDG